MFTRAKRHGWLTSTLRFVPVIAIAAAALIAMAPTDARAQRFNVVTFACLTDGTIGVDIDIRGLGHTDLCLISTVTTELDCACVGGGDNCPRDAKKQTTTVTTTFGQVVQSENGRVDTDVTVPFTTPTSAQCNLTCPSGQTPRLIQLSASGDFRVCLAVEGEECNAANCTVEEAIATAEDCGAISDVVFPGRRGSCAALFE